MAIFSRWSIRENIGGSIEAELPSPRVLLTLVSLRACPPFEPFALVARCFLLLVTMQMIQTQTEKQFCASPGQPAETGARRVLVTPEHKFNVRKTPFRHISFVRVNGQLATERDTR